jgi:hypothetical protein
MPMTGEMNRSRIASRVPARLVLPLLAALAALAALTLPAAASASVQFQIVNESGRAPEDVYVTVTGSEFDVPGMANNVPKKLSEIGGGELTVNKLVSGRVYIAYGAPVHEGEPFSSQTRFDWAELTVHPDPADVANLTAVDQFAIGMRMEALNGSGQTLETIGTANSNTVFNALQQIPGGAGATVKNGQGEIVRILSPLHSGAYPTLGPYVKSMAGQTITLHTAFYGTPFTTTEYQGTFAADGSIALHGTTNPGGAAPATIEIPGSELIANIYTGANTPNDAEGAIRRDLYSGFSAGFWGGKYGNDALSFCTDPNTTAQGSWCPHGFNQPAFGEARASLSPFPTCEQYAAVINQYSDSYGNPYSDASKKTTVSLNQANTKKLRLTVLPDSGSAMPVSSGNPNCGAGTPAPAGGGSSAGRPKVHFLKRAKVKRDRARVARLRCGTACGQIRAVAKRGKKVVAKVRRGKVKAAKPWVVLHLTKQGRRMLRRSHRLAARVNISVRPAGGKWARYHHRVKLVAPR